MENYYCHQLKKIIQCLYAHYLHMNFEKLYEANDPKKENYVLLCPC